MISKSGNISSIKILSLITVPTPSKAYLEKIETSTHIPDCLVLPTKIGSGEAGEKQYQGEGVDKVSFQRPHIPGPPFGD